jgi:hypothetical protein
VARIFEGRLWVHYGQAYVLPNGSVDVDLEGSFVGQRNGLCGAADGRALFLITGLHTGGVYFLLDVLDAEPAIDLSWEEIVEAPFSVSVSGVSLVEWGGQHTYAIPISPGTYRVRYCARNMQRGRDIDCIQEGEAPVDFYSLEIWPSKTSPDVVLKQTSEVAEYWHQYARTLGNQGSEI